MQGLNLDALAPLALAAGCLALLLTIAWESRRRGARTVARALGLMAWAIALTGGAGFVFSAIAYGVARESPEAMGVIVGLITMASAWHALTIPKAATRQHERGDRRSWT